MQFLDVYFHDCVSLSHFASKRLVLFTPPAHFGVELMKYYSPFPPLLVLFSPLLLLFFLSSFPLGIVFRSPSIPSPSNQ